MNRTAVATLAALLAHTGLAWGRADTPEPDAPALPRTVFPTGAALAASDDSIGDRSPYGKGPRALPKLKAKTPAPPAQLPKATAPKAPDGPPMPRPSVLPVSPPRDTSKPEVKQLQEQPKPPADQPKPAPNPTVELPKPTPKLSSPIRPASQVTEEPAPLLQNPVVEDKTPLPAPTPLPPTIPASPAEIPVPAILDSHEYAGPPSYATNLVRPPFPWTKTGKRYCGAVFLPSPYFWADFQYLFGWIKNDATVPLVTAAPPTAANPGVRTDPQTRVLFDGQNLHEEPFFGGRFSFGFWFDECQMCGLEAGYTFLAAQDRGFIAGSSGAEVIAIPFLNARDQPPSPDAAIFAEPGTAGTVQVHSRSRTQNVDFHGLFSFGRGLTWRTDAIVGVRWMILGEDITIEGESVPVDVNEPTTGILDRFECRNDFIGGDFGFKTQFRRGCWSLDVVTRVALGGTHSQISNFGFSGASLPDQPPVEVVNGLLTGPANSGNFKNDIFSVVPEVGFTAGYQARNWLRLTLGYTYVYWDNVVRPGAQIDPVVNPQGVPILGGTSQPANYEPRRPAVFFRDTDFWVQSLTLGIQVQY